MNRKGILLILDGLGDLPAPSLDGLTPLEAANTPVMNRLASAGFHGLVDPIGPGLVPNTHSGCGALMGVFPEELGLLKRGPVEASGAGQRLEPGDVAVRTNFATLDSENGRIVVLDRRAGRITENTEELASVLRGVDLGDGITGSLWPTDQHRCVLVLSGPGLDPGVSDTDPGDGKLPAGVKRCSADSGRGVLTAEKINRFIEIAHSTLKTHPVNLDRTRRGLLPANGIITRGAGAGFSLRNAVTDKSLSAAVVAGCNTVIGLARTLGYELKTDSRFTADALTDVEAKLEAALVALQVHDLVYVHIKAPDLFGHDHQPEGKRMFLERIDHALRMLEAQPGLMIAIAADHSTDCNSGSHTADPVPAFFYAPSLSGQPAGAPVDFGETACAVGNMPRQTSHQFLSRVLETLVN